MEFVETDSITVNNVLSGRLLLLLDRRTLRLLAGNCRLQKFNVELSRSLEHAMDAAVHTVSVLRIRVQLENPYPKSH